MKLLEATVKHMARRRLPVLKEPHFYPTEASIELPSEKEGIKNVVGTCMRAAWYRYMGCFEGQPYSSYTHWIFLTGKSVEEGAIENWKQMGIWVDNNVKFYSKEHNISGEIDCIIRDPETGENIILECKTYWGYEATKEIKGNPKRGIPGKPKDAHLMQALIYLDLHKKTFSRAKILYFDKVCQNNAEFDLTLHEEGGKTYPVVNGVVQRRFSMDMIYDRYHQLAEYVKNEELPPREFELVYSPARVEQEFADGNVSKTKYADWQKGKVQVGDFQCRYCKYSAECWGLSEMPSTEEESEG